MRKGAVLDRVTNGVAVGGVSLPVWEQHLVHIGAIATALVPILSAAWLAIQMVGYLRKRWAE